MSWSTTQQTAFARQGARLRQQIFSGDTNASGYNLQYTDTAGTTHNLRWAFRRLEEDRTIEQEGYRYDVDAVALMPDTSDLTLSLGDTFTYLPRSETYRLEGQARDPGTAETKLLLRRVEGQAI